MTAEGFPLTDAIAIPEDSQGLAVSPGGQVFALGDGHLQTAVGSVRLRVFTNPSGLGSTGGNLFTQTVSSGQPKAVQPGLQGAGRLRQCYLERSNVDLRRELVEIQRLDRQARAIRWLLAERGIFTP